MFQIDAFLRSIKVQTCVSFTVSPNKCRHIAHLFPKMESRRDLCQREGRVTDFPLQSGYNQHDHTNEASHVARRNELSSNPAVPLSSELISALCFGLPACTFTDFGSISPLKFSAGMFSKATKFISRH